VVSFAPQNPFDRKLDGTHSKSGSGDKEEKIPAPARNRTLVIQLTAYGTLTELQDHMYKFFLFFFKVIYHR